MIRDILVAGGGVGALETALALRAHAPEQARVVLVAPGRHFVHRSIVGDEVHAVRLALADAAHAHGLELVRDGVERVDAAAHAILTQGGAIHRYDALVLAVGARAVAAVPGALTFRGAADLDRLRAALAGAVQRRPGEARVVATAPAAGPRRWSPWALALLVAAQLEPLGGAAGLLVAAPGPGPGDPKLAAELAAAGVDVRPRAVPRLADGRQLRLEGDAEPLPADLVVALPAALGPDLPGVPADERGFVRVDAHGRVRDAPDVYAIGGMTGRVPAATAVAAHAVARRLAAWAGASVPAAAESESDARHLERLLARPEPAPLPTASAA